MQERKCVICQFILFLVFNSTVQFELLNELNERHVACASKKLQTELQNNWHARLMCKTNLTNSQAWRII